MDKVQPPVLDQCEVGLSRLNRPEIGWVAPEYITSAIYVAACNAPSAPRKVDVRPGPSLSSAFGGGCNAK